MAWTYRIWAVERYYLDAPHFKELVLSSRGRPLGDLLYEQRNLERSGDDMRYIIVELATKYDTKAPYVMNSPTCIPQTRVPYTKKA